MKARLRLMHLFLLLIFPACLTAQNWKTVSNKDSAFFAAGYRGSGNLPTYTTHGPKLLKVIFVDSSRLLNSDSIFYFYNTIRPNYRTQCLDTAAPSWLGRKFTLAVDGTERYFNSFNDTITIKTHAALNDTWILAKDSAGLLFRATVSRIAVDTFDGAADSIKTVTIQALQNGNPVIHPYNSLVLEWSKNHGWIKALNFYRFPNLLNTATSWHIASMDTGQHLRINGYHYSGIPYQYVSGNEWIRHTKSSWGVGPVSIYNESYQHDSVISVVPATATSWLVTLKTDTFAMKFTPPANSGPPTINSSTGSKITLITVYAYNYNGKFSRNMAPEVRDSAARVNKLILSNIAIEYFIDTFCGNYIVSSSSFHGNGEGMYTSNGCLIYNGGVSGFKTNQYSELAGFDNIYQYSNSWEYFIQSGPYSLNEITYLKFAGCSMGTKIDVTTLGVNDLRPASTAFEVYPNPASDEVIITGNQQITTSVALYDLTGRRLIATTMQHGKLTLNTANYPSGTYLIELKDDHRQVIRLSIVH